MKFELSVCIASAKSQIGIDIKNSPLINGLKVMINAHFMYLLFEFMWLDYQMNVISLENETNNIESTFSKKMSFVRLLEPIFLVITFDF